MAAFWQDWCVATPPRHCPTVSTTAVIDFLTEMDDVGGVDNVLGNVGKVDFEPESVASDEEGIKLGRTSPDPPALGHGHVHTRLHSTPTQSCTPVESATITRRLQAKIGGGGADVLCDMRMNVWVGANVISPVGG